MNKALSYFNNDDWTRVNKNKVSFFSDRLNWFIKTMRENFNSVGYNLTYNDSPMGQIVTAELISN